MLTSIYMVLFWDIVSFVSTLSFCGKGCKCSIVGLCDNCETTYYLQNGECKSCSTGCLSCSSKHTCEKCKKGYFAYKVNHLNIICRQCATGCTQCTSETNCLQCNAGYFRSGYGCKKCLPECKTCKSRSRCNTCIDGYIFNGTSCQKCPRGYFGSSFSCLPCKNTFATCSIFNGCSTCKKGFFGRSCDQRCSQGCDGNVCGQNAGNCTCKENYIGPNCNMCKPQKYGLDCDLNCSKGCLVNECDIRTGKCLQCKPFFRLPCLECVQGKWGKNCTNDCPLGCLLCLSDTNCEKCKDGFHNSAGQCFNCPANCLNASCNTYNGRCDLGCTSGYWGMFCDKPCSKNCLNGICHNENGTCDCKDGYHGTMCDCPNNCICSHSPGSCNKCVNNSFYGRFCDEECSKTCIDQRCDSLTGMCTSQCIIGYFGEICSKLCNGNCRKLPCHRETGSCVSAEETGTNHILLKSADINVILMACVAVLVIYAIVTTIVLIGKRNIQRRQLEVNVSSEETPENNYQPSAHRNVANSEHIYAVPDATSSGSVALVNMETRDSSSSAEDRDMYIHPFYATTKVRHEYEEVT